VGPPAIGGRDWRYWHACRQPLANAADVVIGIGTRYSDFTTASMTAFQNPQVRFVNINTAEFDAYKSAPSPWWLMRALRSSS